MNKYTPRRESHFSCPEMLTYEFKGENKSLNTFLCGQELSLPLGGSSKEFDCKKHEKKGKINGSSAGQLIFDFATLFYIYFDAVFLDRFSSFLHQDGSD